MRRLGLALAVLWLAQAASAQWSPWLSSGVDDDDNATNSVHVGVTRPIERSVLGFALHHEWSAAWMRSSAEPRRQDVTLDVGYGLMLRRALAGNLYFEVGSGPHVITNEYIGDRDMSTLWHFGSIGGLGLRWESLEIGYRWLHLSNGEVVLPNAGIDLHQLRVIFVR